MIWKGTKDKYKVDGTAETWVAFAVGSSCAAARFCKVQNTKLTDKYYYKENSGLCALVAGGTITAGTEDATSTTADKCKAKCEAESTCKGYQFATDTTKCHWFAETKPMKGDGKTANTKCYVKDYKYDSSAFKTNVLP